MLKNSEEIREQENRNYDKTGIRIIREQENRNYDKNKAKLVRLLWDINRKTGIMIRTKLS